MTEIRIVYIDDLLDTELSEYLDGYGFPGEKIEHCDFEFKNDMKYDSVLSDIKVQRANIIVIDSRLFENDTVKENNKITGEEFMLMFRKIFPFIEVIIVTQNEIDNSNSFGFFKVKKYKHSSKEKAKDYYAKVLAPLIDNAIKRVLQYDSINKKLKNNNIIDPYIKDLIDDSILGDSQYDNLSKKDIDALIASFKEIQEKLENE